MTLYLDSSALLKRYVDEPDSQRYNEIFGSAISRRSRPSDGYGALV